MPRMPVLFVGHGAPLLATDPVRGAELRTLGPTLPAPRAVLMVSAHWTTRGEALSLGPLEQQPLIYDFSGFPEELYRVKYPAPGGGLIAAEVRAALVGAALGAAQGEVSVQTTQRGLDHGSWTPLVHLLPDANVPVLQLSLPIDWSGERWLALGRALAPLRDAGVLIVGSGNVTHNLREVDPRPAASPPAWAAEFDQWTSSTLSNFRMDQLADYKNHAPALRMNHPTEEHWAPLVVAAGAASASRPSVSYPVSGWEFGSLSRRSVLFS